MAEEKFSDRKYIKSIGFFRDVCNAYYAWMLYRW